MFDLVRRVRRNWLVLACVAILLVTVLAGLLQFRGINRMSDAVRRQRRGDVERTLRNFRGDFRATLLQPLPFFRPPPDERNDIALESYLVENTKRWHSNSDRPQLLSSISIGTQSEEGFVFRRLPTGEDRFKTADWPTEFMGYRRVLEERQSSSGNLAPPLSTGAIFTLFQGTAVLIFPIVTGASPIPESQRFKGWCFLEFDRKYLREHLLPELVARHFGGARTQAAIVARDPLSLIYALEPTMTIESLAQVDAGIVLLDANRPQDLQVTTPPLADQQPIVSGSPSVYSTCSLAGAPTSCAMRLGTRNGGVTAHVSNLWLITNVGSTQTGLVALAFQPSFNVTINAATGQIGILLSGPTPVTTPETAIVSPGIPAGALLAVTEISAASGSAQGR